MPAEKKLRDAWLSRIGVLIVCALITSLCGCAGTQMRGWIGGEYRVVKSFPKELDPQPGAGLLLVATSPNTPVYAAGLRVGDVLLEVDHKPVKHLLGFRREIDARDPGTSLPISVLHDGKTVDFNVTVGRETFKYAGVNTSIELPSFTNDLNLWPTPENPGISLLVLGYERGTSKRAELGSVKNSYLRQCNPDYVVNNAGWHFWIAILEVGDNEQVLNQEQVSK